MTILYVHVQHRPALDTIELISDELEVFSGRLERPPNPNPNPKPGPGHSHTWSQLLRSVGSGWQRQ